MAAEVARRMVELLGPRPGETILELAAGVGDTGFSAARSLGPGGRLISTDFSAAMVEAARRRAAELGVGGVDHRVMEAGTIDLGDASVDGVLCRWALMLMPEPVRVLREARRVLRAPGGRAVFAVWAAVERNPWASTFGRALVRLGHMPPPEPGGPGMFALSDPAALEQVFRAAGFEHVQVEKVELTVEYWSFEHYWDTVLDMAANTAAVVRGLSEPDRAEARAAVERDAEPYRLAGGGYRLPGATLIASAR